MWTFEVWVVTFLMLITAELFFIGLCVLLWTADKYKDEIEKE